MLDEKLEPIFADVLRRNAGEEEFHQAVREVLDSLGAWSPNIPTMPRTR